MMLGSVSLAGLRVFEAVARRGSYKAAAGELNLTPSAVSHAILNLEAALGVTVFERAGGRVRLTVSGELLGRHVSAAFGELQRGFDVLATQKARTLLRIHSAPSFAYAWLSPRLPQFLGAHPGIEVRLSAGTDYARFTTDDFDVDIVYGPVHATGVIAVPVAEECVMPLCAPEVAERIHSPRDLLAEQLILSDNKQVRWPHWLQANGVTGTPAHGLRFDRSFLAIGAACDGLGVALESNLLARREMERGRLVAPLAGRAEDITYCGHHLVYPRQTQQRAALRTFLAWVEQHIRDA